jgi:hypothetical protein
MDCPQCGGPVDTYALGGREASVCGDCGYVGIAAEHRGESRHAESWNDALRRFYRARGAESDTDIEVQPPIPRPGDGERNESWDEALSRFRERRTRDDGGGDAGGSAADAASETAAEAANGDGSASRSGSESSSTPQSQSSAGDS